MDFPWGWDCYILLLVKSPAFFRFGGASSPQTPVESGTLVLLPKQQAIYYGARGAPYINDWILFDADPHQMEPWTRAYARPLELDGRFPVAELFGQLATVFYSEGPRVARICSHLLSALLDMGAALADRPLPLSLHYSRLLEIRQAVYREPARNWGIVDAAGQLAISRAHFHSLYRETFGTTFTADVIRSRLDLACEMLDIGQRSIKEIAFACGYHSQVHFCRQFKATKGLTPQEYRIKSRRRH